MYARFAILPLLAGLIPVAGVAAAEEEYAQVTIRERVVVRIQTAPPPVVPPKVEWRERKGPRCVSMDSIQGAAILVPGSVDMILRGGRRVRARFSARCPALAYYSGFYVAPTSDGQICAGRDVIRDRAGGECEIGRFRALSVK